MADLLRMASEEVPRRGIHEWSVWILVVTLAQQSMLPIFTSYVIWAPSIIIGLGIPLRADLWGALAVPEPCRLLLATLAGLAGLGALVPSLNFFLPLNSFVPSVLLLAVWILLLLERRVFLRKAAVMYPYSRWGWTLLSLTSLSWAAYDSHRAIPSHDVGLHYLQSICWMAESALPFGLANLHGRLGFNSLWFSIAAGLEAPFLQGRSVWILNGILFAMCAAAIGAAVLHGFARHQPGSSIFLILTGLACFSLFQNRNVGSFSTNHAILLLGFVMTFLAMPALETDDTWPSDSSLALFLSAFAIAVKPSGLPFVLAPTATPAMILRARRGWLANHAATLRRLLWCSGTTALLLWFPWAIGGIALSGCILNPLTANPEG